MKAKHKISGLFVSIFIILHLINHLMSVFGFQKHIQLMNILRLVYRNIFVEIILLCAIIVLMLSGYKLFLKKKKDAVAFFDKLQIWSGVYLGIFFIVHLSAILVARFYSNIDTNFYFGVAGINTFPINLFFIPYYAFAIFSFSAHIASIHRKKMNYILFYLEPEKQALIILVSGILLILVIFYGLTNHFNGVDIPEIYKY